MPFMTPDAFSAAKITATIPSDLDEIVAIEQALPSPWNFRQFQEELDSCHAWHFVARSPESGLLLGYIFGTTVADEAEILKIAVTVKLRKQGIGRRLLSFAFQHLRAQEVACCFLELRESNLAALAFYLKNGLQQVGLRKSYYANPEENAMIMKVTL